jgi:chromate reductase, NAD(P)H dehydrogenase (quinone)
MLYKVGYLVGSLSAVSINRTLAKALVRCAPPELVLSEIDIAQLPMYNRDYDADFPAEAARLKEALSGVDALLIVTPEYNRSLPAALKNAIDWASRPRGENSLAGKPSAMIGASSGAIGTAVAQQHLRSILGFCNSPLMSAVEGYLQLTPDGFTDDGDLRNHSTAEFLAGFMVEFHDFIDRLLHDRSAHSS